MNNKFIVLDVSEITSFVPINFTERALKYLYIDKFDPKDKNWTLLSGGVLDYESNSKMD